MVSIWLSISKQKVGLRLKGIIIIIIIIISSIVNKDR